MIECNWFREIPTKNDGKVRFYENKGYKQELRRGYGDKAASPQKAVKALHILPHADEGARYPERYENASQARKGWYGKAW